jgi:hypothetical protein
MSLGRSLRMICAVSGSSVRGTIFGKLRELVDDVEWNVAMDDIIYECGVVGMWWWW